MIIPPEVVVNAIKKIHPELELCGYGDEIIQFQLKETVGYRVLTLRSVEWPNGHMERAISCNWYVYKKPKNQ